MLLYLKRVKCEFHFVLVCPAFSDINTSKFNLIITKKTFCLEIIQRFRSDDFKSIQKISQCLFVKTFFLTSSFVKPIPETFNKLHVAVQKASTY